MAAGQAEGRTGPVGFVRRIIEIWALCGGGVLIALVLMSTWSVVSNALLGGPVPGDFEMVEVGVAIAAFSFLPYCQLVGANVTADIFTARARSRTVAAFGVLASLVALLFAALLIWRMSAGMIDYRRYLEVTTILQYPLWISFIPILFSLVLLALAAAITLAESMARVARRS